MRTLVVMMSHFGVNTCFSFLNNIIASYLYIVGF